jgi:hypothetical protein
VNWYLRVVHIGHTDPMLILPSKEAVRVIGAGLPKKVPLHGVVIGVWCVVRVFNTYRVNVESRLSS